MGSWAVLYIRNKLMTADKICSSLTFFLKLVKLDALRFVGTGNEGSILLIGAARNSWN